MPQCAYSECRNNSDAPGVSFHSFPHRNPDLLKKWVANLNRIDPVTKKTWQPSKDSRLCSDHFALECYDFRTRQNIQNCVKAPRRLLDDAVPTVFSHKKRHVAANEQRPAAAKRQRKEVRFKRSLHYDSRDGHGWKTVTVTVKMQRSV